MAKNLNRFFCKECGYETIKWLGQCPSCKSWNTMVEAPKESKETSRAFSRTSGGARAEIKKLKEISLGKEDRMESGFPELDRVLGRHRDRFPYPFGRRPRNREIHHIPCHISISREKGKACFICIRRRILKANQASSGADERSGK